ncbi:hypothetical protein NDU88_003485 [Pleurodeles waltl]|uniref:Uncharacterized protein n=1 Tax=Pleurodeles waltl TaxID=8319 RepID=A0AAV7W723_PLEWA|nr:hypothetical protein NDU88_003485 [Pleurodeles waltl]
MRTTLLVRPEVVAQITKAIATFLEFNDTADTPISLLWNTLKVVIGGEFIMISALDNKIRREKRAQLHQQVTELERIHKWTGAPRVWRQLSAARPQLVGLDMDRVEYAALRLRHTYYVGGNKCGRLLATRLRAQRQTKAVEVIRTPEGSEPFCPSPKSHKQMIPVNEKP